MESLATLESFVRSAEAGSFSAAARRLGLTPAAISRNVAQLETRLGVRLFQRSTRKLTLTEAGERFLGAVGGGLATIQDAIGELSTKAGEPAGTLKLSLAPGFGTEWVMPLLPGFLAAYPAVTPDLHFENRAVDLVAEGFDAAIGGGFELKPGVVARELARVHVVAVASPAFLAGRKPPKTPHDLADWDGVVMRSAQSGRLRLYPMKNAAGDSVVAAPQPRVIADDPDAVCRGARLGLGVAMVAMPHALEPLRRGELVRLLPDWHADLGPISLYFAGQKLLPAKTRAFVDYLIEAFRSRHYARDFSAR